MFELLKIDESLTRFVWILSVLLAAFGSRIKVLKIFWLTSLKKDVPLAVATTDQRKRM